MNPHLARYWINQPSTNQDLHKWHGRRVLGLAKKEPFMDVYFVDGEIVSARVDNVALSPGWPDVKSNLKPSPVTNADQREKPSIRCAHCGVWILFTHQQVYVSGPSYVCCTCAMMAWGDRLAEENCKLKEALKEADRLMFRICDESVPLFSSDRLRNLHKACGEFIRKYSPYLSP